VASKRKKELTERSTPAAIVEPYKHTPAEKVALTRYLARSARRPSARIRVAKDKKGISNHPDHADLATGTVNLMNALGTASLPFMNGLLNQITNVASQGSEPDEASINFVLSVVDGIEPRDEIEAMLASQMAAVHLATMTFARRLAHVENIPQQDAAERAFNKLARTFTTQIEALKRYRSDGKQTVRVERVTVEAGGQAVVGAVSLPRSRGRGSE
jgi:LmbE family N-acetylglucosaminyl deacetylase